MTDRLLSLESWLLKQIKHREMLFDTAEGKSVLHLGANDYKVQINESIRMLLALEFLTKELGPQAKYQVEIILRGKNK